AIGAVVGILAMISLTTFAAGSIYPSPAFVESTITVKEAGDEPSIDLVLTIKNQTGNIIKQTAAGTELLIEFSTIIYRLLCQDDSRVMLFEVRDEEGVTTFLAWQMFSAQDLGDRIAAGASWIPDRPGTYEVRSFAIACLNYSGVFPHVASYEITVV
ncbi:MAG: hypothetical protein ACREAW_10325, partial [Nitrososphaera sp.]